jgi:hypothetical protein
MKRLLISICTLLLVFLSKENFAQEKVKIKDDKTKMKDKSMDKMSYPYTADYSSDFKIGNPAHSKMILELWKDWDDNAFDRHNYFADTVVMYLSDGNVIKGKDSTLAGAKRFRGSMSTATSSVHAWIPLKSVDKNEDWVAVWGTETDTFPDGKTDTRDLHEVWRFNKDGKVDLMRQFASKTAAQQ